MPCAGVLITGLASCACKAGSAICRSGCAATRKLQLRLGLRGLALARIPAGQDFGEAQIRFRSFAAA